MINTVLFDFDGVIADSVNSIFKWFQHAASVFNIELPIRSTDELKTSFFEPFPEFYKYLGFDWDNDLHRIYDAYVAYHSSHPVTLAKGIETLIHKLAGVPGMKLGIVSSNMQHVLEYNLKHHRLEELFAVVKGIDKDRNTPLKPDPSLLLEALDDIGSEIARSVYVGDQPSDVLTAVNASQVRNQGRMRTVSISTGFAPRQKLETCQPRADHLIDHPSELIQMLDLYKN